MYARVRRIEYRADAGDDWFGSNWSDIQSLTVGRYMGEKPAHIPRTQVKIAYDISCLYLTFRVEDRYVRSVATTHQSGVCSDSCVEFFFTPGNDIDDGYFNLEMNCGGTMLFHFQRSRGVDRRIISEAELSRLRATHSMPRIVDPEIDEPVTWTVSYCIPIDILERYRSVVKPKKGVVWRANFYKCADKTSHPHWLTWSKVDLPRPDFHQPKFFGLLKFE